MCPMGGFCPPIYADKVYTVGSLRSLLHGEDGNLTRWDDGRNPSQAVAGGSREQRLLPGEDPDTDRLDDVTHWVSVYTELLDSGRALIDGGQDPSPGVDDRLIRDYLRRLDGRLDFWLQKRAGLTP